jgi:hypothetical protein
MFSYDDIWIGMVLSVLIRLSSHVRINGDSLDDTPKRFGMFGCQCNSFIGDLKSVLIRST